MFPFHYDNDSLYHVVQCQVCAARSLNSPEEYRNWLMKYTRHIVQTGDESRLRDMCEDLLGSSGGGKKSSDDRILVRIH